MLPRSVSALAWAAGSGSVLAAVRTAPLPAASAAAVMPASARRNFFSLPSPTTLLKPKPVVCTERKVLPFSPKQMYDVVADVAEYWRFVPYCAKSTVHSKKMASAASLQLESLLKAIPVARSAGAVTAHPQHQHPLATQMLASLEAGFGGLRESYTSRVTSIEPSLVMAEASNSRLFRELLTVWKFNPGPTPNSTLVDFYLRFTFRNALHGQLAGGLFEQLNKQTMIAFEARARQVYGATRSAPTAPAKA